MDPDLALDTVESLTARMVSVVAAADPAATVPSCPPWRLVDLVDHLGRVHLWAEHCAREARQPDRYPRRDREQPLAHWYAASAAALVATLRSLPPTAPAWTFAEGEATAGFWRRRQVHETAVHLVDALQAVGELPTGGLVEELPWLPDPVCADGVDEVLRVFAPRQVVRLAPVPAEQLVPATRPIAFATAWPWTGDGAVDGAVDGPRERAGTEVGQVRTWTIRVADGTIRVTDRVEEDAVATVTGPCAHLYLALWGRAERALLGVEGDREAGLALVGAPLVP